MEVFWYLPTQGDERYLGTTIGRRPATYPYMQQIAQALATPAAGIALPQQVASAFSEFVTKTDLLKPQPV
ncbi:hypothetical protein A4S05_32925 [Nostoc sp. KVJ20]|uniref:hypothetical protein n=1 Tax=unclassified Nostoc TaxID=2593658 RepID=UPI00083CB7CA|nr:hypothetical protein [Nostoc sp. KVJ20]ODH00520.1 hypothetical protein A4S05_32925 [Nostoc sp. KVJ20]